MQPIDRGDDNLLILYTCNDLLFETVVQGRLQHVLNVVLVDANMLHVEKNSSSIVLKRNKSTSHLLVRQLINLLASEEEVTRVIIQMETDDVAMKNTV